MNYYYLLEELYDENNFLYAKRILQTTNDVLQGKIQIDLTNNVPDEREILIFVENNNENNRNEVIAIKVGDGVHSIKDLPFVNWYNYNYNENESKLIIIKKELGDLEEKQLENNNEPEGLEEQSENNNND